MPLCEPIEGSGTGIPPAPHCPKCKASEIVVIPVQDLSHGVRYWRCLACGAVWGSDEYRDIPIFGDQLRIQP
jgi:hypothetical protein